MRSPFASVCVVSFLLLCPLIFADADSFDFNRLKGRSNLDQTVIGLSRQWTLEKLLALTQKEGFELWRTLPPVPMKELNGHYLGLAPAADDPKKQEELRRGFWNEKSETGYWLGMAFKPLTESSGEGYNRVRRADGKISRALRMGTRIGPSLIDGKPSYIGEYSVFAKGVTAVEELRKLDDFVYFGLVITPENINRTDPMFWILIGPTDEWVGPNGP